MTEIESFEPETLDEMAALLLAADDPEQPVVEGTEVVILVEPEHGGKYIRLKLGRVPELNRLEYDERHGLLVGTVVPFSTLLAFAPVQRLYPMLSDGLDSFQSDTGLQTATLAEALSRERTAAQMALPLVCLRASVGIYGPHGWSDMAVEALVARGHRAAIQPGEMVVDIRLPPPPIRSGGAYFQAPPDSQGQAAPTGVGVLLVMEEDLATCCGVRLAISGAAAGSVRALEAERFLSGKRLDEAVIEAVGDLALRMAGRHTLVGDPGMEHRVLLRGLTRRALLRALERVRSGAVP
jgi:carbon-monoxide dehydrogenase medium subunit